MGSTTQVEASLAPPDTMRLSRLFYPHAMQRIEAMGPAGRLVHYCSAEAAASIIANKEIWLRNVTVMNDWSEVTHGLDALTAAYSSHAGKRFQSAVNSVFMGICEEVERIFISHHNGLRFQTYVTCVSEHLPDEDIIGRLSMWRAYGRSSGVALVMRTAPFRSQTNVLGAYSSPVRYASKDALVTDFAELATSFERERDFVKSLGSDLVREHLFNMFKWAALSIKHPGFAEEREWRVAHTPTMNVSTVLTKEVRTIAGVPQVIYKLPLQDFPEEPTFSTAIPHLLDRLIIGPTEYPLAMYHSFVELLESAGVKDANSRVVVSDIPLR